VRHQSSDAFILATYPLREKDRIVSFLTRDSGKKRGVARGARNPRSQFAGLLEPMTEATVTYFEKDGRELVSINSLDAIRPSFPLSKDLDRALLISALAESLQTFVPDSDPAEPFYRLARHVLDALFAAGPPAAARAYFDVWILKLSGLFPSPSECAACELPLDPAGPLHFDGRRPGFVGPECRSGEVVRLPAEACETLQAFLRAPFDPKRRHKGIAEISSVASLARRHFLGHELKSQRVLEEVLG
jgi:DNA repair protein RecO (recombination protein O)